MFLATFTRARRPRATIEQEESASDPIVPAQPHLSRRRGLNPGGIRPCPWEICRKTACPNSTRLLSINFFLARMTISRDESSGEIINRSPLLLEILISNSLRIPFPSSYFYWNFSSSRYPLNYFHYFFFFFLRNLSISPRD